MMTSVPQFIDVEDKVAGPFSWRQLGWMVGMGAVLFLLYTVLSSGMFMLRLKVNFGRCFVDR
jgi:hypothetical protein